MRTLFEYGFQKEAWRPTLGQSTTDLANLINTGGDMYESYAAKEKAEADAKAAAANAEAAKAAAAAAAAAAGAKPQTGMILGMPTNYVIFGALGLAAVVAAVMLAKKK